MNDPGFSVTRACWPDQAEQLRFVREQVFVVEQKVPLDLEWDGLDQEAIHLLARDTQGAPIGTARLLPDGQIGRMAVLPSWRRKGVGRALLLGLLELAAQRPGQAPFLNAQTSALSFYRNLGFRPRGGVFMEAGIPHRRMVLADD